MLFGAKAKPVLGLDITTSSVKLIELGYSGGQYRVESYAAEPTPTPARWEWSGAAIAGVPAALCALLAYYLAGRQGQDPVAWSALGSAVGLLLGWACLLWIQRED